MPTDPAPDREAVELPNPIGFRAKVVEVHGPHTTLRVFAGRTVGSRASCGLLTLCHDEAEKLERVFLNHDSLVDVLDRLTFWLERHREGGGEVPPDELIEVARTLLSDLVAR